MVSATSSSHRVDSIDALRGIAVLLMIQQHVLYWLCSDVTHNILVLGLGALGGLAAPIFVTLAGVGATLAERRHRNFGIIMPIRGVIILGFGYLLNFLAPHWFSLGAWYVLHLIGFSIIISPIFKRISSFYLLFLMTAVIIATALIQSLLGTPFRLFNEQMGNPINLIGFFRHILAEGFFPIFPWIAYFMAGVVAGRWFLEKKTFKIGYFAAILLTFFTILALIDWVNPTFIHHYFLIRFFTVTTSFYPSLTPIILLLISLSLFIFFGAVISESKHSLGNLHFLSYLGQCSMTLLIVHVAVIRGAAHHFHFWRIFSVTPAVLMTWATLLFFTWVAFQWRRIRFRYGTEWFLRKVSNWSETHIYRRHL